MFSFISKAQVKHFLDTIKYDLQQDKAMFLSLDGKNTLINDLNIKLFGLQVGYLYNRRTNLYIGYYGSYKNERKIIDNPSAINGHTDSNTVFETHGISYFNFGCEYYFHNSKKWRFSVPVGIGIGSGKTRRYVERMDGTNKYPVSIDSKRKAILPLDFGITANYKITWWCWVGLGVGSRITFAQTKYSGTYYSFGLSLRTGEIYRRFRTWYRSQ